MLLNICYKKRCRNGKSAVAAIFYFILCIGGVSSLARVDNWSHRRPNATVAQNQWGQPGYRPAGGVAYQQPFIYNRNNQTLGQQQWHLNNNRNTQQYQQPMAPVPIRPNQTLANWNQSNYARNPLPLQGALNQTRPYSQGIFNQTRPVLPPPSITKPPNQTPYPSQGFFNQSRPAGSQPAIYYTSQNSSYGQTSYNQSRPAWSQPSSTHIPLNPAYSQSSFNQSRPTWSQPSAPFLPNNPQTSASNISNLYPALPNYPNSKPAVLPNSWIPSANQTRLYPQLPNQSMPQPLPAGNNNGISLAPLQPQPNIQGPHNWHSGGQSSLSYGPGYYPPPADNSNKTSPNRQGSSNPYANMFI